MEPIVKINKNKCLAELVGIILGDGSFFINKKVAELDIAFNLSEENYCNYVKRLLERTINSNVRKKYEKKSNCVHLRIGKRKITEKLLSVSLIVSGNKIKNQVTIPNWIWENVEFLKYCIKGLIDTDGSLYRLRPHWPNLFQLSFKNNNKRLLEDVRKAIVILGFKPSRVFGNRIVITRQDEIKKYFKVVGTNNLKYSPVV